MAEKLSAHCHCGAVAFTVELSDGFNTVGAVTAHIVACVGRSRSLRRFQE
ncbi:Gfa-like protein [Klebsiella pneumoniae]|nr:Gfa-like protein [Klebsiella pneumoniae]SBF35440.1 Gfa-like protein [Klebsiella pneumoniae]SBF49837.1 Gfa-like protein [Klebsiella pneumoniae]SBF56135.1 Gfa-like protein [Klebsiella pneumoniae]SBF59956.1 Gfa-like protein [Klebsiella pneumoniae]